MLLTNSFDPDLKSVLAIIFNGRLKLPIYKDLHAERSMMLSNDVNALVSNDAIYHILLWLPVKPLMRFKSVGKSWHGLIESSGFIKEHLHYHHYDRPCLKNENHNLIFWFQTEDPSITFPVTSVQNFEAPTTYLQLDLPNLHEYFPAKVSLAIFHGIVCLHIKEQSNNLNHTICLWNPATKQCRLLPQSPFSLTTKQGVEKDHFLPIAVGFGFDVKTNDYKVVKVIKTHEEKQVEVYDLSTDSWRSIDTLFPVDFFYGTDHPKMPFKNGTGFCWKGYSSEHQPFIFCFDLCFENFRSISFPNDYWDSKLEHLSIVSDKITCVYNMSRGFDDSLTEIWMFNDYGSIEESWAKLYSIDDSKIDTSMGSIWLSMDGKYVFFGHKQICRYNLVTQEINYFSCQEFQQNLNDCRLSEFHNFFDKGVAQFKESLISVGGGNYAPT